MATKKYGIRNTSECVIRIPVGKSVVVCNFADGNLQSREPIPASYTTTNPIIQHVIEHSELFNGGKIFLMAEYNNGEEVEPVKVEPEKPKKPRTKKAKVNDSVTTFGEAVTALMMEEGVAVSDLGSVESCLRVAEELGISFPNLKA
jgi:hypothetical protein